MAIDCIPLDEFTARRKQLLRHLDGAVGLIFAGTHDPHDPNPWRPDPNFEYLTGITDEGDACILFDPTNPVESRRVMLFLRPLNPELEKWDGLREPISSSLRDTTGMATIFRLAALPRFLMLAARRSRRLACLHALAMHTQPVSQDLTLFRQVAERIPGVTIEDRSNVLPAMRAVKSKNEVAMIRRAVEITARGFEAAMRSVAAGQNEFDVQETLEHTYRRNGSRRTAFHTIAGSGINSTVLHYRANDQPLEDGDLMVIDSGATFQGYSADVTRTIPVNGRFTDRQREVYDIVLKALAAATRAAKPGVTLAKLDKAARDVITKAGYGDAFIHGIGHHLGLETHDADPDAPLQAGAVITIEPGIYLPDEKIGVRIEDDVVITAKGATVLSKMVPKQADEIERVMAGKKASPSRS